MDPHILASIPPAQIPAVTATSTVFSSVEANNHVAPSPPPTGASAPIDNAFPTAVTASGLYTVQHASHPPYAEMIYTAISALKEKNGSTKRAIAKYIDQVYKEHLPATHSALLTHHLKRLKNNGLLVMVKNSYMVPRSDQLVSDFTSSPQSQRGRGRPPKPKPQPELQPQVQPHPQPFSQAQAQPIPAQPNADVFAALGLGDEPALEVKKKGPGRPPKSPATGVGQVGPAVRKGRPPGSGRSRAPKRAGRPPKPKSVSAISNGLKRRPGRPPKNQYNPTVIPFAAPASGTAPAPIAASAAELASTLTVSPALTTATASVASPRPRGRPRKNAAAVPALAPAAAVPVVGAGRGRGRGRGRGPGRGRGRWVYPVMKQGQPLKISSRRPVGRPRKGTAAPTLQNVASEELRRKLEYFQSKVKEALGVIKPHFNHESPVTAIAAIQELEILATLDLDAPLRDEMQQPQQLPLPQLPSQQQPAPQQQQLPQQQMYHQQLPQVQLQPQPLHQYQPQAPGLS